MRRRTRVSSLPERMHFDEVYRDREGRLTEDSKAELGKANYACQFRPSREVA